MLTTKDKNMDAPMARVSELLGNILKGRNVSIAAAAECIEVGQCRLTLSNPR